jgi:RNA polymerase-binding transcription factor
MSDREPPIDEAHARELLQRERERIEAQLADVDRLRRSELDEIESATDPSDDTELIEERALDEELAEPVRGRLEAIGRAEKRLNDGTYGFSVESGEPIPAARLEAIPWAERTTEEQQRYERIHGRPD